MAGYLEAYGASEEKAARRIRVVIWLAIAVAGVALTGFVLYSIFENYAEERQIKTFVGLLKSKDYPSAYRMWGCTSAHPCRDYSFERFMEDWGPQSPHANASAARVGSSDSCGTGVLIPVNFPGSEEVPLWVDRSNQSIGFSPDPECRKRRWHVKEFIRSLFGGNS